MNFIFGTPDLCSRVSSIVLDCDTIFSDHRPVHVRNRDRSGSRKPRQWTVRKQILPVGGKLRYTAYATNVVESLGLDPDTTGKGLVLEAERLAFNVFTDGSAR